MLVIRYAGDGDGRHAQPAAQLRPHCPPGLFAHAAGEQHHRHQQYAGAEDADRAVVAVVAGKVERLALRHGEDVHRRRARLVDQIAREAVDEQPADDPIPLHEDRHEHKRGRAGQQHRQVFVGRRKNLLEHLRGDALHGGGALCGEHALKVLQRHGVLRHQALLEHIGDVPVPDQQRQRGGRGDGDALFEAGPHEHRDQRVHGEQRAAVLGQDQTGEPGDEEQNLCAQVAPVMDAEGHRAQRDRGEGGVHQQLVEVVVAAKQQRRAEEAGDARGQILRQAEKPREHAHRERPVREQLEPLHPDAGQHRAIIDKRRRGRRVGLEQDVLIRVVRQAVLGQHVPDDQAPVGEVVVVDHLHAPHPDRQHGAHDEEKRAAQRQRQRLAFPEKRPPEAAEPARAQQYRRLRQRVEYAREAHRARDEREGEADGQLARDPPARKAHVAVHRRAQQYQPEYRKQHSILPVSIDSVRL